MGIQYGTVWRICILMLGFNRLMTNNAEILWKPGHNYSTVFHSLKQGLAIFSLWHSIKNIG